MEIFEKIEAEVGAVEATLTALVRPANVPAECLQEASYRILSEVRTMMEAAPLGATGRGARRGFIAAKALNAIPLAGVGIKPVNDDVAAYDVAKSMWQMIFAALPRKGHPGNINTPALVTAVLASQASPGREGAVRTVAITAVRKVHEFGWDAAQGIRGGW